MRPNRTGYNSAQPAASRKDARATKNPVYQGKPCKAGHNGLRYTADGKCVFCPRELVDNAIKDKPIEGRDPRLIREIEYRRDLKKASAYSWDI